MSDTNTEYPTNSLLDTIFPEADALSQAIGGINAHPPATDAHSSLGGPGQPATGEGGLQLPVFDAQQNEQTPIADANMEDSGMDGRTARKRPLVDKASHNLLNTKNPRADELSNARPLQLKEMTSHTFRPRVSFFLMLDFDLD